MKKLMWLWKILWIKLISFYCKEKITLKPPNDILINKKKICGILQEIIQKNYQSLPKYFVKEISNSSIEAKFEATCSVKEANLKSKGEGKTRKRSELEAAAIMLQLLKNNES